MLKTSIIMRSFNDSPELVRQTMTALLQQQGVSFRLIHIDSGSSDGTLETIKELGGEVFHIRPSEYIPGRVLNFGMNLCDDELVTFLNADAVPVGNLWLLNLLEAAGKSENVAACFSRQISRADTEFLFDRDNERAFGDGSEHARWRHFFSMAASVIRRSFWERQAFDDGLQYSEDIDWTYRARKSGGEIVYVPDSAVTHSHNYTFKQSYKRHYGEGRADACIYSLKRSELSLARQVVLPTIVESLRDLKHAIKNGRAIEALKSPALRISQKLGRSRGLQQGALEATSPGRNNPPDISTPTKGKYTPERNPEFEERLDADFALIVEKLKAIKPAPEVVILGGGYGRREGGILQKGKKSLPYNDYDLYAVFKSDLPRLPQSLKAQVRAIGEESAAAMGIDVDIEPVSSAKLEKACFRIEWYELRRGNMVLYGAPRYLDIMSDYRGSDIPYDEGQRLLMNRGVGMLLARERLDNHSDSQKSLNAEDLDFVTRNIYKALLAAGDAVLLRYGLYHYSYRERLVRFEKLELAQPLMFKELKAAYAEAHDFRLHPKFMRKRHKQLLAFWENSLVILESAQLWFLQSTLNVSGWQDYALKMMNESVLSARGLLNVYKTARHSGSLPSVGEIKAYTIHPQMRVRAAAPLLLYGEVNERKAAMLSRLLFMPEPESLEASHLQRYGQLAEMRLIQLWQEVN